MKSTPPAGGPTRSARCCRGGCPPTEFTGKRLYEVLDLCLECKACKAECPSNVDMAKIKYEFLYHYYQANGLPLRNRLFGPHRSRLNRLGVARCAPLSNWIAADLAQPLAHGEGRGHRPAPRRCRRFAPTQTFTDWFAHRPRRRPGRAARSCCSTTCS